jgi:alpha-L-rhamnosidase
MDGAKRDRFVWSGDIGISGLTILYDSGAGEYIAGSVRLHGDYATSSGEAAGFLPSQLIPRAKPSDNNFSGYTFTPDYSIYFVTSLYNYYLYTGDKGFVNEEWPAVDKEMNYLGGLVDPTHHGGSKPKPPKIPSGNYRQHFWV